MYSFILIHLYLKHLESFASRIFTEDEINEIRSTTFKDVILSATNIPSDSVQDNVFVWKTGILHASVVDPGFPGSTNSRGGYANLLFYNIFCQTLHKNERIRTQRGHVLWRSPWIRHCFWICAKSWFQKGFVLWDGTWRWSVHTGGYVTGSSCTLTVSKLCKWFIMSILDLYWPISPYNSMFSKIGVDFVKFIGHAWS